MDRWDFEAVVTELSLRAASYAAETRLDDAIHTWDQPFALKPMNGYAARERARAHQKLGIVYRDRGDLAAAETSYRLSLALMEDFEDTSPDKAGVHLLLGEHHIKRGDLVAAEASYRLSLSLFEGWEGTSLGQAVAHQHLGSVHLKRGDLVAAEASYRLSLALFEGLEGTTREQAVIHQELGVVHRQRGDLAEAEASGLLALSLFEGAPHDQAAVHQNLGVVQSDRGDLVAAEASYRLALSLFEGSEGTTRGQAIVHQSLGNVHLGRRDFVAAEASYRHALMLFEGLDGTTRDQAIVHLNLGNVHDGRGDVVAAEVSYRHALMLFEGLDGTTRDQAVVHQNLGRAYRERGDLAAAKAFLNASRTLYSSLDLVHEVCSVDASIARLLIAQADVADDAVMAGRYLAEALALVVPAALDVDVRRFQFARERERMTWATEIAAPTIRLAFSIAARVGDAAAVADLIAHSRASGIPTLGAETDSGSEGGGRGALDIMLTDAAASAHSVDNGGDVGDELTAGIAVSSGLGLDGLIRRKSTPPLRMPDGRTALQRDHPNAESAEVNYL